MRISEQEVTSAEMVYSHSSNTVALSDETVE